jgi:pimeloyl-ACP methyl ester carboxylesterase
MAHIVLVHGAMHGAWCWERVAPELAMRGHAVDAIDLPGLGGDATPAEDVTAQDWADAVAAAARRCGEPSLLVGHSLGGTAIAQAAEREPEHVLGLVFVAAIMIGDGETILTACPETMTIAEQAAHDFPDDRRGAAMRLFYGATDPAVAEAAFHRLRPQPKAVAGSPLHLTAERFGRLKRAYIECTNDVIVPLAAQRRMQARLPCEEVVTMQSDHSPFLCAPVELADHLDRLARRFGSVRS